MDRDEQAPVPLAKSTDDPVSRRDLRTAGWGGLVGTALENYDFTIYGTATALVFNKVFFTGADPAVGVLAGFATYAVGFLARPVGGLLFSRYGDRLGRKFVLVATLMLMGTATMLIGVLPTYPQVGALAPALLVVLRLLQGLGAGAEQAGAAVLLTEIAPVGQRGRYASLVWVGAGVGAALAAIVWLLIQLLPADQVLEWGWRLAFLSSIFVTIAAYILRRRLREAPVFLEARARRDEDRSPIASVLKTGRVGLARTFFLNTGPVTHSYIVQVFMGSYVIQTVKADPRVVPPTLLAGAIIGAIACWGIGILTDKVGRRPVAIGMTGFMVVFPVIAFPLLDTGQAVWIGLAIVIGFVFPVLGAFGGFAPVYGEMFGSQHRYAGVALAREFSAAIGGGFAPLISGALVAAFAGWGGVAVYMAAIMLVSFVTAIRMPETRDRDLLSESDA